MNQRIKLLALQAGYNGHYATEEFDVEKFAELIVRDCANLCLKYETMIGLFNAMEYRKGRHFNTIIKHHFGIEQ